MRGRRLDEERCGDEDATNPTPATCVTFAPPIRSVIGPATMRMIDPTSGPMNAYFKASCGCGFGNPPKLELLPKLSAIKSGNAVANPENSPKVIM